MFQYLTLLEASNCICEIKLVVFGFVVSRSEVNLVQPIWWLWTAGNRKHILAHFSWGLKHKDNDGKRKESSIDPFVMGKREDSGKYFMCIFTSKTPLSLVYPKVQAYVCACMCFYILLFVLHVEWGKWKIDLLTMECWERIGCLPTYISCSQEHWKLVCKKQLAHSTVAFL